jgi:hypothetical protein
VHIERSVTTVSWIPSDMLAGMGKLGTRMGMAHNDPPPPDVLGEDVTAAVEALRAADQIRFANHLTASIDVDDNGHITGHAQHGGGLIGATTVALGIGSVTVPAVMLPDRIGEPEVGDGWVRFTQTVGGRTGVPMPRPVKRPPFVQYHAPIVWTTLELTIHVDGTHTARMTGASGFPRHWVYDNTGALVAKSSLADYKTWMGTAFGGHTPWGDEDSPALVTEVETALERELSVAIMRAGRKPDIRRIKAGRALVEQGADDDELYLLLNGVLAVEVDGQLLGELGPGAVLGERAVLEGGKRTATLRAVTDCKVAAVPSDRIDLERLEALSTGHRREEEHRS